MNPESIQISSKEEALNWVIAEITEVERHRLLLVEAHRHPDAKVGQLRRAFWKFVARYGAAMGNAVALWRTGYLTRDQYEVLRQQNNAVWANAAHEMSDLFD